MSTAGGSIAVSVHVPIVGEVVGRRTLADIASGKAPEAPVDGPAVVVRDMGSSAVAAVSPRTTGGRPSAVSTGGADQTPDAARTGAATPTPPAPSTKDPEAEAGKLYQLAENYLRANMKSMAVRKLEELLKKYPKTEAAEKAQAKLAELK